MFDLSRFHTAQDNTWSGYHAALAEIRAGRKTGHWIWYIFPQIKGLGKSDSAVYYSLESLEEAKAYAADPVLIARLREISQALLDQQAVGIRTLMGSGIDCRKLCSCMTLFEIADPDQEIYGKVLDTFYRGQRDDATRKLLGQPTERSSKKRGAFPWSI